MLPVVKLKICFIVALFLMLYSSRATGQEPQDSTGMQVVLTDTTTVQQTHESEAFILSDTTTLSTVYPLDSAYMKHSPAKAAIMSAVLPGLGQVYNKKYWKVPIVYAAIGTSVFIFLKWQNKYEQFRRGYIDYKDGDPYTNYYLTLVPQGQQVDINQFLTKNKDRYRTWRDWSIIAVVLSYGLNIIDANVDAHLLDYNIDDNISLNIRPCFLGNDINSQKIGLNLRFTF